MIRKFLSVFSGTPSKSKLLSHSTLWSGPCLAYLWLCSSGFSHDLFASATGCLLAVPPPDEALVRSGLTHAVHWTWNTCLELHVVQVKSVLKCLLREVFLSSIPLAFFIFFMALWIFEIALFFCSLFAPMERKLYKDLDCWVSCSLPCAQDLCKYMEWLNKQILQRSDYWWLRAAYFPGSSDSH